MPTLYLLGLILSAGIGVSLGLLGGGGSILTLPVLVYALGVEPRQAVGMSLLVVGVTSLLGAYLHRRRGSVEPRTGLVFAAAGLPGAWAGSSLTYLLTPSALLLTFAGLMVVVAVSMLLRRDSLPAPADRPRRLPRAILAGAGVGLLTGFLGVGGGFLIVPALVFFAGLEMRRAVGTSLLVIAANCAAGLAGHLRHGGGFEPGPALAVTVLAAAGAVVGTALSHRVEPGSLRQGFALFVLAVAAFLVVRNV